MLSIRFFNDTRPFRVLPRLLMCVLSALCMVCVPEARGQAASSSRPMWTSRFLPIANSSLSQPVTHFAWLARNNRVNPSFDWHGGVPVQSPLQQDAAHRLIGFNEDSNTLAMEWQTNAPRFELLCAPMGGLWRVFVRDANDPAWTTLGQWRSTNWNVARVQVFSDASGERRARRFRVEYANQLAWGIRLERSETIAARPPVPVPRRVVWCGDSFVEGAASPSMWQGFAAMASAKLGLDAHFDASGGTGYVSDGPPEIYHTHYENRLQNIVAASPSIVVVYGSVNDVPFGPAQVARAAASHWNALRRALPGAQIVVIGPIRMGAYWDTAALNTALRDAAASAGLPYIDGSNWIKGTGKQGEPHHDGNADTYLSVDGTHPTAAGHLFLAQKVADALRPLVAAK